MNLFQQNEPTVEVTRSFSYKHGLPSYSAVDGFYAIKATVPASSVEEAAAMLYATCQRSVMSEIVAYSVAVGAPPPKLPQDFFEAPSDLPDLPPHNPSTEESSKVHPVDTKNPFRVTTLPPAQSVAPPAAPLEVPKSEPAAQAASASPSPAGADTAGTVSQTADTPPQVPPAPPVARETQAAPTEPPTRPRGRQKKPQAESYAPGPVVVPDAPKDNALPFKATDADLPPNIARKTQYERLLCIVDVLTPGQERDLKMPPTSPWAKNKAKIMDFLRAFGNLDKLPVPQRSAEEAPEPFYHRAVPVLEAMARLYPGNIRDEAAKAGLTSGDGYNKLVRHIDNWRPDIKRMAIEAAMAQYPDFMEDLIVFVELDPPIVGEANLMTFLELLKRSKEIAAKVRASGKPMFDLMQGLDLESCSEGEMLGRLA